MCVGFTAERHGEAKNPNQMPQNGTRVAKWSRYDDGQDFRSIEESDCLVGELTVGDGGLEGCIISNWTLRN